MRLFSISRRPFFCDSSVGAEKEPGRVFCPRSFRGAAAGGRGGDGWEVAERYLDRCNRIFVRVFVFIFFCEILSDLDADIDYEKMM